MRAVDFPKMTEEEELEFFNRVHSADTNNTYEALEAVDKLLKPLGFELMLYNGFSDFYFEIVTICDTT